ncbi:hypothetical protein GCM10012289_02070 [Nonomuraea cavernae]|uniref:Uncharacterized protein n=1 Tax=Nonomuraea cavernae TaxID=2045107 RepID=A0A917YP95_9ACTN|nr:hypothetical protein GCM10012289_02070 [Nonomuraea cavernae]
MAFFRKSRKVHAQPPKGYFDMSEEDRLAWARGFAEELRDERDGTPDDTSPSSGRDDSKDGP